jgi:organic hydroperoxide reductase OsmC/OhrA
MSIHRAEIAWALTPGEDFDKGRYSRGYAVTFEGGHQAPGTASAHVVGNKWSVPGAVDPEEMFVGSVSACHMLTFLHRARLAGFTVTAYADAAEGVMEKIDNGQMAVTRVTLRPQITYTGRRPTPAERDRLHHEAHEECFIANSITTKVVVEEAN